MSRDNRLLVLALFFWGLGEGLFIFIQPLYLRELGADPLGVGAALSLAAAAAGLAHLPAGYLADHLGRKTMLVAGFALGAAAALGMFLARDLRFFVPALMLYSLTGFVLAPLSAYITEARGQQTVQRALTLVFAGFWAGNILSPAIGGWIGQTFGLRYAIGASLILFAVSTGLLLGLRAQPVVPPQPGGARYAPLLRNRAWLGFLALTGALLLAMQVGLPLMPNFLEEVRGLEVGVIGLLGSINALGVTGANLVFGRLRRPWLGLLIAQGAAAAALGLLLAFTGLPWLMAAYFLRAGWNLALSMILAQAGRMVSQAELGLAYGVTETVVAGAQMLGPLAAGALYAWAPALPFQVSLGLVLLTLPLVWRFAPRRDAHSEAEAALT
ncbi:MAG: MFS transporter [Anaerolineales bacterium]|nr:MFS transporter [Anaerolineales bacterium]